MEWGATHRFVLPQSKSWVGKAHVLLPLEDSPGELLRFRRGHAFPRRWNLDHSAVLYAALEERTACREALAQWDYYGLAPPAETDFQLVTLEVQLRSLCDLTCTTLLEGLGITPVDLRGNGWRQRRRGGVLTQRIGETAFGENVEALLVPSAVCDGGRILVLSLDNLSESSKVRITTQVPARDWLPFYFLSRFPRVQKVISR